MDPQAALETEMQRISVLANQKVVVKTALKGKVKECYHHGIIKHTFMDHNLSKKEKLQFVKKVLTEHENLDLSEYKPFIHQFEEFSQQIFDFETIFSKKLEDLEQPPYLSPTKSMIVREQRSRTMSPKDLEENLKKLPPHEHDNIPIANMEIYEQFGQIGWFHVMHEILKTENLPTKLKFIRQVILNRCHKKHKTKKATPNQRIQSPHKRAKTIVAGEKKILESKSSMQSMGHYEKKSFASPEKKSVIGSPNPKNDFQTPQNEEIQEIIHFNEVAVRSELQEDIIDKTFNEAVAFVKKSSGKLVVPEVPDDGILLDESNDKDQLKTPQKKQDTKSYQKRENNKMTFEKIEIAGLRNKNLTMLQSIDDEIRVVQKAKEVKQKKSTLSAAQKQPWKKDPRGKLSPLASRTQSTSNSNKLILAVNEPDYDLDTNWNIQAWRGTSSTMNKTNPYTAQIQYRRKTLKPLMRGLRPLPVKVYSSRHVKRNYQINIKDEENSLFPNSQEIGLANIQFSEEYEQPPQEQIIPEINLQSPSSLGTSQQSPETKNVQQQEQHGADVVCPTCNQPSPDYDRETSSRMKTNASQNTTPTREIQEIDIKSRIQFLKIEMEKLKEEEKKQIQNTRNAFINNLGKTHRVGKKEKEENQAFQKLVLSTMGRTNKRLSYQKFAEQRFSRIRNQNLSSMGVRHVTENSQLQVFYLDSELNKTGQQQKQFYFE